MEIQSKPVFVLAAHEPDLDPRIEWIAKFAPAQYEMRVVGFADSRRSRASLERRASNYTISRLSRERQSRRVSISWVMNQGANGNRFVYSQLLGLVLFGVLKECPAVLLWAPVALVRRLFRILEKVLLALWDSLDDSTRIKWKFLESSWFDLRRRLRSVFEMLFLLRQRWQFRPNRLFIFLDAAQYFYGTTKSLVSWVDQREVVDGQSVVHANDLETLFAGVDLKRRYSCRLIYDAHEFWPHSDVSASWWETKFWEIVEKKLSSYVDHAFTVSNPLAKLMTVSYGTQFDSVPNAEPLGTGQLSKALTSDQVSEPIKFVFQGGFAEKRGLEQLIRAWSLLRNADAKLVLRGPDSEIKDGCIRIAKESGQFGERVIFAPPVEETELVDSLKGFDVGIIPYEPYGLNYTYCCPNKLSQYMKAGLAVLHNDLPYVTSVVEEAKCGWKYDGKSAREIARVIDLLIQDRAGIARAKVNANSFFRSHFNWQKVSVNLYESY